MDSDDFAIPDRIEMQYNIWLSSLLYLYVGFFKWQCLVSRMAISKKYLEDYK